MQTKRTLSRSTLTVQDVTVTSARKPRLPSIATPRCDLRPTPGTALQPTKRRKRFSRPGACALRSYGALLEQVYYKEREMSSDVAFQAGRAPAGARLSIPRSQDRGLSPLFGKADVALSKALSYLRRENLATYQAKGGLVCGSERM